MSKTRDIGDCAGQAVVFLGPDGGGFLRVAALSVLDRLVVSLHRAGVERILVIGGGERAVELRRSLRMGIAVERVGEIPELEGRVLVASACLLVHASDLRRIIGQGGRLETGLGEPLPVGLVDRISEGWEEDLGKLESVRAEKLAVAVTDPESARKAEQALWASLASSADGVVDRYFNRPAGRYLSRVLIHTPVSPNAVSVGATLLGLGSAWLFGVGEEGLAIWGALLLQVSAMIDCVDGDLARVLYKESSAGRWLDICGDQVVHLGLFAGIGVGLARAGSSAPVLLLAGSAVVGVVISFLVVLRGLRQPERLRNRRLQKLMDATTNRDFSVLLIALVLLGRLEWFMWVTAIGVHVFWVLALAVQKTARSAGNEAEQRST